MLLHAVCILAHALALGDGGPERGRDPWVFRAVFEDRTGMALVALDADRFLAVSPHTCWTHKAWRGPVELRGKVWDFSQDNARAQGVVLCAAPTTILELGPGPDAPDGWTFDRVAWADDAWVFAGAGASMSSPARDLGAWARVFLAFDERSRRGRLRVEFSTDAGASWDGQWFGSSLHVNSDSAWQWNFKEIVERGPRTRFRLLQTDGAHEKSVSGIRLFGDRPAWRRVVAGATRPADVRWLGYRLTGETEAVTFLYDVAGAAVRHRPEIGERGWTETVSVANLEPGTTLVVRVGRLAPGVTARLETEAAWTLRPAGEPGVFDLSIGADGSGTLVFAEGG